MPPKGRRTAGKRPLRDHGWLLLLAVAVVAALAYALTPDGGGGDEGAGPVPVTEFSHVHGLAVNPERPSELLVATHHGLIRRTPEGGWERIGPVQDYMGFTTHPTDGDTFWASGHPPTGGNLGVIRSTDGGLTWRQIALDGVDFHAMAASPADPDVLWGHYRGQLYRSTNGGEAWDVVNPQAPRIASLAGDAADADTVYATTGEGVARSRDGGRTFERVAGLPALGLAPHPHEAGSLLAAGESGVHASTDGGATWTLVASGFGGGRPAYLAFDPTAPDTVYLATLESAIHRSDDGGRTWREIHPPTP